MHKKLFEAKNVIVQGITGTQGSFHTAAMIAAGTNIVAGTSPHKAGERIHGVTAYSSINDILKEHTIDASVIFVPAVFAKHAMIEAINAKVSLVICITEGVPVHDMLEVIRCSKGSDTTLIGPNCPGVLVPGVTKLGIIPASMSLSGTVGIVSRSGTLTYEMMAGLTSHNIGQRYIVGIGGDRIQGTSFIDCLKLFEEDDTVDKIVLIGEIGGVSEHTAAEYIRQHVTKPVYAYVAGHHAPINVQLGHAGAILGSKNESAQEKTGALQKAGAITATNVTDLINLIAAPSSV